MDKNKILSTEEKAKIAKREYMRDWNSRNKDKVKAAQDRYWARQYSNSSSSNVDSDLEV